MILSLSIPKPTVAREHTSYQRWWIDSSGKLEPPSLESKTLEISVEWDNTPNNRQYSEDVGNQMYDSWPVPTKNILWKFRIEMHSILRLRYDKHLHWLKHMKISNESIHRVGSGTLSSSSKTLQRTVPRSVVTKRRCETAWEPSRHSYHPSNRCQHYSTNIF